METVKNGSALLLYTAMGLVGSMAFYGCGSSGGSSGSSTTSSSADSLSDLPSTSSIVTGGAASTSISAKSLGKAASGTPPLLKGITSSNIDTYFYNGKIAEINAAEASAVTEAQRTAFWQGEGACRMAQTVGYAFQNILQGTTSLCYMQNAPGAANGVSITSGDATAANIFNQGASTKVVKVVVSNMSSSVSAGKSTSKASGGGSENIFIKVYGSGASESANGLAIDMWFCSSAGAVGGSEEIRVNNSTNTFTSTSVHSDFGNFVGSLSASLTTNASGQFVFDSSKDRSATVYFGPTSGEFIFLGSVAIDSTGLITARDLSTGTFGSESNTNKHAVFANYIGNTMDELRFSAGAFYLEDTFGSNANSISDATEFNGTRFANVDSGSLLTLARAEGLDADLYSGTSSSQYTTARTKLSGLSSLSCSTTPDVVVAMDFSQSGPIAVAAQCENHFSDMNFCDSTAVQTARNKVFLSQALAYGTCSTTRCPYDVVDGVNTGVFACQQWADNNRGNSTGITTLNATCSTSNCCTTQ